VAALSAVLLDFASKLRALAVDGVVELEAVALKSALGMGPATPRTLRNKLAALEDAKVIRRESGRGPGALIRVVFVDEKRKEKRKEAEIAEGVAEEAETEGGRGEATQLTTATREKAAAAARPRSGKSGREAEGVAEEAETRTVLVLDATPELVALLRSIVEAVRRPSAPSPAPVSSPPSGPVPAAPSRAPRRPSSPSPAAPCDLSEEDFEAAAQQRIKEKRAAIAAGKATAESFGDWEAGMRAGLRAKPDDARRALQRRAEDLAKAAAPKAIDSIERTRIENEDRRRLRERIAAERGVKTG
jgi:hypothetical protein